MFCSMQGSFSAQHFTKQKISKTSKSLEESQTKMGKIGKKKLFLHVIFRHFGMRTFQDSYYNNSSLLRLRLVT